MEKGKNKMHPYRLYMRDVQDDYVMGIIAEKLNIVAVVYETYPKLKEGERARLFAYGRRDASKHSLAEVGRDIWKIYKRNPMGFYNVVGSHMTHCDYEKVMDVVKSFNGLREQHEQFEERQFISAMHKFIASEIDRERNRDMKLEVRK